MSRHAVPTPALFRHVRNGYVTDIDLFFEFLHVPNAFLGDDARVSTTVEVRRLAAPDFLVEIDAITVVD